MELRELVSGEVITIGHASTVAEGAAVMQQESIGSLAVARQEGRLVGVASIEDVLWAVTTEPVA